MSSPTENDEKSLADWRADLAEIATTTWELSRKALGLTSIPALLHSKGHDVLSILSGRKLLPCIQLDAEGYVVAVRNHAEHPVWGIVPPGKEEAFEANPIFEYLGAEPSPSGKKNLSPLDENAPWKLDPHGEIVPKITPKPKTASAMIEEPSATPRQKTYATTHHPPIAAIINRKWFFPSIEKANARLQSIRDHFVFSKAETDQDQKNILWIKGFALDEDDKENGYWGHFAILNIEKTSRGYTMSASKLNRSLAHHPQRARHKSKHPNWGHPLLRRIKKGGNAATHDTASEAQSWLDSFHEEFPEATIPGEGQLFAHVYVREGGDIGGGHIQKIVLKIQDDIDGRFRIYWHPNYRGIKKSAHVRHVGTPDQNEDESGTVPHIKIEPTDIRKIIDDLFDDD